MPTVLHRLEAWASTAPQAPAQRFRNGGQWKAISARELRDNVYHLALFLESRGLGPFGGSVILSSNCPEWVQFDLAALLLGARSAGIYPNSSHRDTWYILNHTEATVLAVGNREFFNRITGESGPRLPDRIRLVVVFDGDTSITPGAIAFADAVAEGRRLAASGQARQLREYLDAIDPKAGTIMIYTSGTTGNPKGALLSHDNLVYASDVATARWRLPLGSGELFSFLPLCHVAETLQNIGVGISRRFVVNFCSRFENASKELVEVQPTHLLCVPRVWEKMMEGVQRQTSRATGIRRGLAAWALGVGARVAEARYAGKRGSLWDRLQLALAERLVLSKIRRALGLGRAELLASGAAALPAHVARWFRSLGLEILEDYGQTESTGILCMTEPGTDSAGTVGKPIPGLEFRLAADGEIMTRGRHVFVGYFNDPAATAAVLTQDGWLHTGDIGEVDERGLVRILGRKKEVLKTSGGKMVAPLPIEERLRESPLIGQACMVGEGRKFLSALLTLSEGALADLRMTSPASLDGTVVSHPPTLAEVGKMVADLNRSLAQYAQIKRFVVISREFSISGGEMTPTLKMKRRVIESNFRDVIDSMYASEA
jgi:long-chain acyl-CoA synthetase